MMTERPNVARSGASPLSSVKLRSTYWSTKPSAAISGITMHERGERAPAEVVDHDRRQEGGEHDQVAVREVDQAHHAEDQRQARGEQRVEPPEEDALDDRR